MSTVHRRVRFLFGDHIREGDVVDELPTPAFNDIDRTTLTVDVPGRGCYRVLDEETIDV